jgi:hypothetical protein
MISDQNSATGKKSSLSSGQIRNNFRNNTKNRHIGLKITVGISAIIIALIIYYSWGPPTSIPPNAVLDTSVIVKIDSVAQAIIATAAKVDKSTGSVSLYVRGKSLKDLRDQLLKKSNSFMAGKYYTPKNCKLKIRDFSFTCDLEPKKSNFTKLSLVYGPKKDSCVSCKNVMSKNIGSLIVDGTATASMIYEVIAIFE